MKTSELNEAELKDSLSKFSYTVKKSQSMDIPDLFKHVTRNYTNSKTSTTKPTAKSIGAKDKSTSLIKHPPDSINFDNCLTSSQSG